MKTWLTSIVAFAVALTSAVCGMEADKCPPCRYESKLEGDDCFTYSNSESGTSLMAWEPASELCLASLGVEERIMRLDYFWAMCPNPNATDAGYTSIVGYLQDFPDTPIAREIKELFADRGIFVQDENGNFGFPEIYTNPQSVEINCNFSPNQCWNEVRVELEGRVQKMNSLCANLHDRMADALALEQAKARQLLCEKEEAFQECEPLSSALQAAKPFSGDCSPFGEVVDKSNLPECPEENNGSTSSAGRFFLATFTPVALLVGYLFV